jgi:hypothetical protein
MPLSETEYARMLELAAEAKRRLTCKFVRFFPDAGPFARDHYPKQVEFFAAGARYKERLFMAANRVGKSEAGAYEVTCHLTGQYPDWWGGGVLPSLSKSGRVGRTARRHATSCKRSSWGPCRNQGPA